MNLNTQQDLIKQNIENIKNASLPQLLAGGFQIFLTRLPVIAAVVSIVNLPVAIYYALFRTERLWPVEIVEATGEVIMHEELLGQFYTDWFIDLGMGLYTLIAVLAVAFIVELTIHGEMPHLNAVMGHAVARWWDGLRTGALKGVILIGLFLIISIIGSVAVAILSAILPEMVAFALGGLFMLALVILPLLAIAAFLFFDLYASSLRNVGGMKALRYSLRISRKHWWKVLGGLVFVFAAVNFPLFVFQSILATLPGLEDPAMMVIVMLVVSVLSAFSMVVYSLYFLHFDFLADPVEDVESFKDEK